MTINQLFWAPLLSRALSHHARPSRSLKRPVCSPEAQGTEPAVLPARCPKVLELHHSKVTSAKVPPSFAFRTRPTWLVRTRFSVAPLLGASSVTWKRKCSCISLEKFDTLNHCLMGCTGFFRRTLVCGTKCHLL